MLHFFESLNVSYNRRSILDDNQNISIMYADLCLSLIAGFLGVRWLSGRELDSGARGSGFESHDRRVVSFSKTL